MTKSLGTLTATLFVLVAVALLAPPPAGACTVDCDNGSCSSDFGTCTCDDTGDPVCEDKQIIQEDLTFSASEAELAAFEDYLSRLYATGHPELIRVADAGSELVSAVVRQDAAAYLRAVEVRQQTLEQISDDAQLRHQGLVRENLGLKEPAR